MMYKLSNNPHIEKKVQILSTLIYTAQYLLQLTLDFLHFVDVHWAFIPLLQ